MDIIITNIYIFIMALILAILEIQVEGEQGWAKNLPTWRAKSKNRLGRAYMKFMNGKEMTGYHLVLFAFILLILHLPYTFGLPLTLGNWLKTISFFFMFAVLWDFLWFVLNPHYPLRKFKKKHILWHKRWFWLMPVDYYLGVILSFLVLIPLLFKSWGCQIIDWWLINILLFITQTIIVILFTILVLKIDKWNTKK